MAVESQILVNEQNAKKTQNCGTGMTKPGEIESIIHHFYAKQSQF